MESIENKIVVEEKALEFCKSATERVERLNTLIQLKLEDESHKYDSEIYVDIKQFINSYIKSLDEKKHHYDDLRFDIVANFLLKLRLAERIKLQKYFIRSLKIAGYEESIDKFEESLQNWELKDELSRFKISNIPKMLYLISTYNWYSIFFTFIIMALVSILVLLPAPSWSKAVVIVSYHKYSDHFCFNHVLNILSGPLEISDDFKIVPIGVSGLLVCTLGKLIFALEVISVLFRHIEKKIKAL